MRTSRFGGVIVAVLVAVSSVSAVAAGPSSGLDPANHLDLSTFPSNICMADHGDVAADSSDVGRSGRINPKSLLDADAAYLNGLWGSQRSVTSDGTYNYRLNYRTGDVIRYDSMWGNPDPIFSVSNDLPGAAWITMNPADGSFWLSQWGQADLVAHFSPTGKLLSSFNSGVYGSVGLVFNPADDTLWLGDKQRNLYQFDLAGNLMSSFSFIVTNDFGGISQMVSVEGLLYLAPVPEPSGLSSAALALVSLSAWRWRSALATAVGGAPCVSAEFVAGSRREPSPL